MALPPFLPARNLAQNRHVRVSTCTKVRYGTVRYGSTGIPWDVRRNSFGSSADTFARPVSFTPSDKLACIVDPVM